MATNYEVFMNSDVSEYSGKWIAITDGGIVASGDNVREVLKHAQALHPNKKITLAKVPEEETMIF
ncbi:MAG: DUF5678 domain-containing protein [Nanoarchaeota archaeon]